MDHSLTTASPAGKPKLLEQVRQLLRLRHYSLRTEEAYLAWIRRFILFHARRQVIGSTGETPVGRTGLKPMFQWHHPAEMAEPEVGEFLTDLARAGNVSAST